jgi:uncharacterized SAM-binding protein YcdF (DUF218 family)
MREAPKACKGIVEAIPVFRARWSPMFFLLSKIAWLVIQPVGLLVLSFSAILLASFFRALRLVRWLAFLGLVFILVAAQTNAGRLMLQPLENRFPRPAQMPSRDQVAGIIVLGGGFDGYVTQRRGGFELGESGDRFVEALRLARALPEIPLVISGGEASLIRTTEGDASIAARFFGEFGIPQDRLVLENRSLNTYENAVMTKAAIGDFPDGKWLLVTSAFHMPRSVGAFRLQGVEVIPWPADFRTSGQDRFAIGRDDPMEAMSEVSLATREWIGLAVYAATGRIGSVFPR